MHDSVSVCCAPFHRLLTASDRSMRCCGVGCGGKEYVWSDWFAWVKYLIGMQVVNELFVHHNG